MESLTVTEGFKVDTKVYYVQDVETGLYFYNGKFESEEPQLFGSPERPLLIMRGKIGQNHPHPLRLCSREDDTE